VQLPLPFIKNVVLVGGGHAHALVLRKWAMKPMAGVRLTVINPSATAPYTGMLPGFIAGHYERSDLDIDLVRLARFADARLVFGAVSDLDREAKTVTVPGRPPMPYDLCSIDVGITAAMPEIPGFAAFGIAAKPLDRFAARWESFVETRVPQVGSQAGASLVVIGGGVAGCELAMAMAHRLRSLGIEPTLTIVDSASVLSGLGFDAQSSVRSTMKDAGINVLEHRGITQVTDQGVHCDDGEFIAADLVVGAAGARPYPWLGDVGLDTHQGFITVTPTLQSTNDTSIFATGDCAHMAYSPRPKAGVFAVRQAPVLFANLQAELTDKRLKKYEPQQDYLKLISLGFKRAAADKYKRLFKGRALWRLKDKIDRDFMRKLSDLPAMKPPEVPSNAVAGLAQSLEVEPPLCGGCGAKVGADILSGPLASLPASARSDVIRLPGDDAALLDFGGTRQVITTDSLRSFTSDPYRMAKIAALHAMGDIWAMGAAPQAVLVTVTLPQLSRPLQSEWLSEIMAGASQALAGTGAEIVGGHTSMGAELSLGFSITGLVEGPAITLAGATPGQKLVVTRPLGSGLLFAGEMQMQASGRDIEELLSTLEVPQGKASEILATAGATAMTDVTGFGLAGHLFGILRESNAAAELTLEAVPLFDGALDLAKAGLRSHLHAANKSGVPIAAGADDPRIDILFDPQTAGGMLAAIPAVGADATLKALSQAGFPSAIIGDITKGGPRISVV